jgi:DNA repair protein SbcD/Mre11
MSEFSFLHAADIHLDSPMRGLEADPDAPASLLREASRSAFRNLIDLALSERVAFMVIAGDLYDGAWEDWRTGLYFTEQVARLAEAGIPLVMVAGNHDAASVITRHLRLPKRITMLPHEACGRVVLDEFGVAIHGQSFASKSVSEDLTRNYPAPIAGLFNIGLLHTALTGRPGHDNYAPTTVETLIAKDYDYWALGHVHAREEVNREPWVVFPGNLQGRQIREGGPKGATLVSVRGGRVQAVEHRPLDEFRWSHIEVPLNAETDLDGAMARVGRALAAAVAAADGRPLAARVTLCGPTSLHGTLLGTIEHIRQGVIAEARHFCSDRIWIEQVRTATTPMLDFAELRSRPDAVGRLVNSLDGLIEEACDGLLGDYPQRLRDRIPDIDLPADHPLAAGGHATLGFLKAARDLVLAQLAQEA